MPMLPLSQDRASILGLGVGVMLALLPALSLGGALGNAYLGSPTPDLFDHVYLFEDSLRDLRAGSLFPLETQEIRGPTGGILAMPDRLGALIYMALRQGLPRALAFNLALLSGIAFGALGAGLLARSLGAKAGGVLLASALFGGSSYAYAQLYNGETETLRLGALSFGCLALVKGRRALLTPKGPWTWPLIAGATLGGAFFASWYYGAYLLIIAGVGLGVDAIPRLIRSHHIQEAAPKLLGALAIAGLLLIPQAIQLQGALDAPGTLFRMPTVAELLRQDPLALGASSADLANVASPGALAPHAGYLHGGFIGAVLLTLGVVALLAHPVATRVPLALGGGFFLLALGPQLHIGGDVAYALGEPITLPYGPLGEWLPYFGSMRLPYRAMALTHLGLALGGGLALGRLVPWLKGGTSMIPGLILALGVQGDVALYSGLPTQPAMVTIPQHPGHDVLRGKEGGILDLPMGFLGDDRRGIYLAQQVDHGLWTPYSLMSTQLAPELATNPLIVTLGVSDPGLTQRPLRAREGSDLDQLLGRVEGAWLTPDLAPSPGDVLEGKGALEAMGLHTIALHTEGLGDAYAPYRARLTDLFGDPTHSAEGVEIYTLNGEEGP